MKFLIVLHNIGAVYVFISSIKTQHPLTVRLIKLVSEVLQYFYHTSINTHMADNKLFM